MTFLFLGKRLSALDDVENGRYVLIFSMHIKQLVGWCYTSAIGRRH